MSEPEHHVCMPQAALRRVAGAGLAGAPLATFLALLAHMDDRGFARITQPQLCELLGTSPGRVWQSLQALVAAGIIEPPVVSAGAGRRAPYRIVPAIAVARPSL